MSISPSSSADASPPITSTLPDSGEPPSFICPITQDIMTDPVMDRHGHTFEKAAILDWLRAKSTCPMNQQLLSADDLAPNRALKEVIESYHCQGPQSSPRAPEKSLPSFQEQSDTLAKPLLASAQDLEEKGQLLEAEQLYLMALQFTTKSEDYAHLPRLLEKKGEKERAATAYITLSELQMKENKPAETIASLKKSLELIADPLIKEKLATTLKTTGHNQEAALLFLELAQQTLYNKDSLGATRHCHQSLEAYPGHAETWKILASLQQDPREIPKTLLRGASEPTMPVKERIELCRIVLIKDPEHLPATLLSLELNQLKMKEKIKRLKQEVSKITHPPAAPNPVETGSSSSAAGRGPEVLAPLTSMGPAEWAQPNAIQNLPPYPPKLVEFLEGPCPIWEGKTARETHIVVPLFPTLTLLVDGIEVPRTLSNLDELDKSTGGVGFRIFGTKP